MIIMCKYVELILNKTKGIILSSTILFRKQIVLISYMYNSKNISGIKIYQS